MKHKESFNATLAIGFILILAAWVTFRMWELPEIFKFANTIHIIVILGCFGIISWNILKLDYRNKYMDRMTGINNDAWIVRQGAILYYRNKLNGYDAIFLNVKDCKYINQKVNNQNGDIVLAEYAISIFNINNSLSKIRLAKMYFREVSRYFYRIHTCIFPFLDISTYFLK